MKPESMASAPDPEPKASRLPPNPLPSSGWPPTEKPRRRPRYRGTHPRRFQEKYKELQPDQYPETVRQVLAAGKTPAGSHRPIAVREVLDLLQPQPGDFCVDATLGYGGHAEALLRRILPGGHLLGLDVDPIELPRTEARLRSLGFTPEVFTVHSGNFAGLARLLAARDLEGADCLLADLGCSSMQLDNPERGFSYKLEGPLDLRLNPRKGQPASAWLSIISEERLAQVLIENADEPQALLLAAAIKKAQPQPITTTRALSGVIQHTLSPSLSARSRAACEDTLRRVFQALRIAVNDEFSALETFLRFLPDCLKPGGRVVVITFHSGEDRRVKKAFQAGYQAGLYAGIAREIIRPGAEEIRANPRSASAKIRWARRAVDFSHGQTLSNR